MDHEGQINIHEKLAQLRKQFFKTDRHQRLETEFDRLLLQRRAGGNHEARGIVLIGDSGSGKTTSLRRLFVKHPNLVLDNPENVRADVISLSVPSPATPKFVGMACLTALGYPLRRDRTASIIWELAAHHLKERQTLFLHLDEAQDFTTNRASNDQQSLINTIKSLMQNPEWPVGVILSGMPQLLELVNRDPQLARRMIPINMYPLKAKFDSEMVFGALAQYSHQVQIELSEELKSKLFIRRLIHSSADEFGIAVELIIGAIEVAILHESPTLNVDHFSSAFERRTSCIDALNPFIAEDYLGIRARQLLGQIAVENSGGAI